jgi:hypothetical protein
MQEPTTTAAEIGRDPNETENEDTTESFTPTEAWIKQYQKQATPKLIAGLNQFARTRALTVANVGRKVDDDYARELVLDALGDTWLGVARWDPDTCSLGYHVVRTIEGRADKHRKQALQRPHDALGDGAADASETMSQIRALATNDEPVLRVLDAYDAGCETKDEVLAHARMKSRTYHNAYVRLGRIVRFLTDHKLASTARA